MLGVATGTPATAPAVPQTDAPKRSAAALALRRKQIEEEAKASGAGTTNVDKEKMRVGTSSYLDVAARQMR